MVFLWEAPNIINLIEGEHPIPPILGGKDWGVEKWLFRAQKL